MHKDFVFAKLAPELLVENYEDSLAFWVDILGFNVVYSRPEKKFVYLEYNGNQVMFNERNGRWETDVMQKPYGRGINLSMEVEDAEKILINIKNKKWPIYEDIYEDWYRAGDKEVGCKEFLVQDPNGYLLRFSQHIGIRPFKK